jgi:hypothetical protein
VAATLEEQYLCPFASARTIEWIAMLELVSHWMTLKDQMMRFIKTPIKQS